MGAGPAVGQEGARGPCLLPARQPAPPPGSASRPTLTSPSGAVLPDSSRGSRICPTAPLPRSGTCPGGLAFPGSSHFLSFPWAPSLFCAVFLKVWSLGPLHPKHCAS